jgi:dolichol-phosphate mannosyltransferase
MIFYRFLDRMSETPIPLDAGDFRLMNRRVLDTLNSMPERHRFIRGMVSWTGYKQVPMEYDRDARIAGKTKYPLRKLFKLAIDGVTAFSVKPLAFASFAGVICAIFAIGLLAYSLISWLFFPNHLPQGWTSLMAAIAILGSVQLFVLGIIGEYLGRLYEQSKGRPLFMIESVYNNGKSQRPA